MDIMCYGKIFTTQNLLGEEGYLVFPRRPKAQKGPTTKFFGTMWRIFMKNPLHLPKGLEELLQIGKMFV